MFLFSILPSASHIQHCVQLQTLSTKALGSLLLLIFSYYEIYVWYGGFVIISKPIFNDIYGLDYIYSCSVNASLFIVTDGVCHSGAGLKMPSDVGEIHRKL